VHALLLPEEEDDIMTAAEVAVDLPALLHPVAAVDPEEEVAALTTSMEAEMTTVKPQGQLIPTCPSGGMPKRRQNDDNARRNVVWLHGRRMNVPRWEGMLLVGMTM
jgi:hypothetical protein